MSITIRLHEANKEVREVTVNDSEPIQVLQQEVHGEGKKFIVFNRNVLMTAFSFRFFGIKDGDDLYVLRSQHNNKQQKQRKFNGSKSRATHTYIKLANGDVEVVDKSAACECIRLLDLLYMKDEIRQSPNRRISTYNEEDTDSQTEQSNMKVEIVKATEPSTNSLPIFWSNRLIQL